MPPLQQQQRLDHPASPNITYSSSPKVAMLFPSDNTTIPDPKTITGMYKNASFLSHYAATTTFVPQKSHTLSTTNHLYNSNETLKESLPSFKRLLPSSVGQSNPGLYSSTFSSANSLTKHRSSSCGYVNGRVHQRPSTAAYHASVMLNRSGKEALKEYLASINALCDEQEQRISTSSPSLPPPIEQCTALSHWSTDAYYAIVISKNGGIATVLRVMQLYLELNDSDGEDFWCDRGRRTNKGHANAFHFQACCVLILMGLCQASPRLRQSVLEAGGRETVLAVIEKFPGSFDTSKMALLLVDTHAGENNERNVDTSTTVNVSCSAELQRNDGAIPNVNEVALPSAKQRVWERSGQLGNEDDVKAVLTVSYF
jgi:hypothetical protein